MNVRNVTNALVELRRGGPISDASLNRAISDIRPIVEAFAPFSGHHNDSALIYTLFVRRLRSELAELEEFQRARSQKI